MKKPTNLFKRAAIAVMAASIVAATPTVASAAWETTGKGWNWIVNGQKATGWQWIDSQWYFMDSTGTMKTGWVQEGGSWYYLAPSGAMATGWTMADGTWYYLKSSGAMATGWVNDNGSWYRMNTSGAMITGWTSWNGGWYYMAPGGDMVTGVIKVDGATYAMDATGKMQTGEVTIEGKTYTFGEDGAAVGEAPEATRTFSGAAETTNTGTGTGGTTTPSKPNRPSYGGGGSSTPDPDPNPDPGPGPVDPPVEEDREDVADAQNITTAAELTTFMTDIAKKHYTNGVTVNITDGETVSTIDFSELSTNKITIQSVPTGTTVTLNPLCSEVVVNAVCKIESEKELPKVTVNVDADTPTLALDEEVTVVEIVAPVDVLVITQAPGVVVSKNVQSATISAPLTVATGATVTDLTVSAADITIDGAGNVGTVEASTNAITVDGVTVTNINTAANVTVSAGTVTSVNVSETANSAVTVTVNGTAKVDAVTNASQQTVTIDGTSDNKPAKPTTIAAKPVKDTDYTVVTATAADPTATIGITYKGNKNIEYIANGGSWETAADIKDLNTTPITEAGTYHIRVKASGEEGQDGYVGASQPVTETIATFSGWANDNKHYEASVVSKDKWVVKTANAVECYVGNDGTVTVTFTKADCKVTDGVFADGITETTEGTAKLVIATGSAAGTVGANFDYKTAEAGTYTVQVAVGTAKSTLTATITKEAAKPEAPAVPAGTSTEAGKIVITGYNADAGLEYKLYKGENAETATLVSDAKHTNGTYTGLEAGKYYLTASKDGAESAKSAVIDVKGSTTTPDAPAAPAGTSPEAGKIVITDYNANAGLEYKLYKGESAETATAVDKTHTDGTYTGLEAGKYYLTASKDGAESAKSAVIDVKGSTSETPSGAE